MTTYEAITITDSKIWHKIQSESGFIYVNSGVAIIAMTDKNQDGEDTYPSITTGLRVISNNKIEVPENTTIYAKCEEPALNTVITPNY